MSEHPVADQDVAEVLADLRSRLRGTETVAPPPMTPLQKAIAKVNSTWHVSGRLPPPENAPLRWQVAHFARRVARRLMVEVLNTVVEQQNAFNAAAAQALTELAKENQELTERIKQVEGKQGDK